MTLSRNLFLSILSMDSYNRDYGVSVVLPNNSVQIGHASIIRDSSVLVRNGARQDIAAGFYALAYDMTGVSGFANGELVISYRGTNPVLGEGAFRDSPIFRDAVNGWLVAAGIAGIGTGQLGSQGALVRRQNIWH